MSNYQTDDPDSVRAQYTTEDRLQTRRSVWRDSADGRNPADVALAALTAAGPSDVLEVGAGTGLFAGRLVEALPDARVIATDQSDRFVEMAAELGVPARFADVQDLPFADDEFDAVVALWMLYHVPDLDRAMAEIRRVLRPGGVFVAITNGDAHLADLLRDAGGEPMVTGFSTENGAELLRRHFEVVDQDDIATRAVFEEYDQAVAYLATFDPDLARGLPVFDGPREYAGATTVFVAR